MTGVCFLPADAFLDEQLPFVVEDEDEGAPGHRRRNSASTGSGRLRRWLLEQCSCIKASHHVMHAHAHIKLIGPRIGRETNLCNNFFCLISCLVASQTSTSFSSTI